MDEDEGYKLLEAESAYLINAITGAGLELEEKEGKVDMCKGIADMRRHAEERGFARGEERGFARGEAQGEERSLLRSLRNVMETLGLSPEDALTALKVPESERPQYLSMLQAQGS